MSLALATNINFISIWETVSVGIFNEFPKRELEKLKLLKNTVCSEFCFFLNTSSDE